MMVSAARAGTTSSIDVVAGERMVVLNITVPLAQGSCCQPRANRLGGQAMAEAAAAPTLLPPASNRQPDALQHHQVATQE